jgi:hypothetical protein
MALESTALSEDSARMEWWIAAAVVLVALAFLAWRGARNVTQAPNGEQVADRAAELARRGETVQARRLLVSASDAGSPGALFVLASIELEEGNLEAVSRTLARLRTLDPQAPEGLVLSKLLDARHRAPQEAWTDALISAWNEAGRPRQSGPAWLAPTGPPSRLDPAIIAGLGDTSDALLVRFAEALGESAQLVGSALSVADGAEQPFAVQLAALAVLSNGKLAEPKRAQAHAAARRILAQLSRAHPDNGYLCAGVVLGVPTDSTAPLSAADVASLEGAVKQPVFDLSIRPIFVAFRDAYQRVDPGQASSRAWSEMVGVLPLGIHVAFSKRVAATTDPELRARAWAALDAARARLGVGRSLLERMIGVSLQMKAAQFRGDAAAYDAAVKTKDRLQGLIASMAAFTEYGWPIASFWRDWLDRSSQDEVALAKRLAE